MLNKIKLSFAISIISHLLMNYGVYAQENARTPFSDCVEVNMESEDFCLMKTLIEHHRQYGMAEENRRQLIQALKKIGRIKDEKTEKDAVRFLTNGYIWVDDGMIDADRNVLWESTAYLPFENVEIERNPKLAEACAKAQQQSYESALNRLLYLLEITYQKCKQLNKL